MGRRVKLNHAREKELGLAFLRSVILNTYTNKY